MNRAEQMVTTPIENVLREQFEEFHQQRGLAFLKIWEDRSQLERLGVESRLVPYHVSKLGKWQYTFTNDSRMYVWEFPTWRVFVSNRKGACLEVLPDTTPEAAWEIWREYLDKMGVVL